MVKGGSTGESKRHGASRPVMKHCETEDIQSLTGRLAPFRFQFQRHREKSTWKAHWIKSNPNHPHKITQGTIKLWHSRELPFYGVDRPNTIISCVGAVLTCLPYFAFPLPHCFDNTLATIQRHQRLHPEPKPAILIRPQRQLAVGIPTKLFVVVRHNS